MQLRSRGSTCSPGGKKHHDVAVFLHASQLAQVTPLLCLQSPVGAVQRCRRSWHLAHAGFCTTNCMPWQQGVRRCQRSSGCYKIEKIATRVLLDLCWVLIWKSTSFKQVAAKQFAKMSVESLVGLSRVMVHSTKARLVLAGHARQTAVR